LSGRKRHPIIRNFSLSNKSDNEHWSNFEQDNVLGGVKREKCPQDSFGER